MVTLEPGGRGDILRRSHVLLMSLECLAKGNKFSQIPPGASTPCPPPAAVVLAVEVVDHTLGVLLCAGFSAGHVPAEVYVVPGKQRAVP